ncbi:hypothetical protein E1B28_003684 [Marasmius oreades]|uniref:Uncharacterized protein n=1 Tax=Marasmius oreades TaxID=181124 RepID=A0A9P7UX15_9AGAR|nr:uncharacterized protein E1B28_003684 [Marasmius oreades]KAG7096235.1 hypothetical protein E1B28_003684 [Marasmius oreades]
MSSTDELQQTLALYLSAEMILTTPISTLSVQFCIYGIYCFIFGLSIHVLFWQANSVHRLYKGGNIALFVLATIYTFVNTWALSRQTFIEFHAATTKDYSSLIQYVHGDNQKIAWIGTTSIISTLMNSIADTMLIHRCYLIFNSNKLVLFPLVVVASILNVIDLGSIIFFAIEFGSSSKPENNRLAQKGIYIDSRAAIGIAVFQIILTSLTGGCIWWITRQARQFMRGSTCTRYNNITAIIVESGLLYAGSLLTSIMIQLGVNTNDVLPFDFSTVSLLMSGLAPTMVIAQVAYGKSVESIQQTISMFGAAIAQASQQNGTRQGTIYFQLQTQPGITINGIQEVEETSAIPTVDKV